METWHEKYEFMLTELCFLKLGKIHFAGFVKMGENSAIYCAATVLDMWKSLWKMWITLCSEKLLINLCEYC